MRIVEGDTGNGTRHLKAEIIDRMVTITVSPLNPQQPRATFTETFPIPHDGLLTVQLDSGPVAIRPETQTASYHPPNHTSNLTKHYPIVCNFINNFVQ